MKILNAETLEKNIEESASYDLSHNNITGSSYYVYQRGNLTLKKHFGTVEENGKAVGDETIFRLASMTKPITAVAMLILIDRGLICLDDEVYKYIPSFKNIHVTAEDGRDLGVSGDVTIKHLLTHTSGFGRTLKEELTDSEMETIDATVEKFVSEGLEFEPFTKQVYSPFAAFDVLAKIAEAVTGEDYADFLENEIFIPCGMKNTTFEPTHQQWENVIKMHDKSDGKNVSYQNDTRYIFGKFPCGHKLAGAGLVSTIDDYALFSKMLLSGGKSESGVIVSKECFDKLHYPYVPKNIMPGSENWGLGVRVITGEDYKYLPVDTYGWSGAYGSHFWIDPKNEICAVFMKNSLHDGGAANCSAQKFEKAVFEAFE